MTSIERGIRDLLTKYPFLESEIVYAFGPRLNDLCHKLHAALANLFSKFARTTMKKSAKDVKAAQDASDAWTTASDEPQEEEEDDQSDEEQEGEVDKDSYEYKAATWTAKTAARLVLQRLVPYNLSKQPVTLNYPTVSILPTTSH